MTKLTTERYRDIHKWIKNSTERVLSVQYLVRLAVAHFFERYGCYPDVAAAAPGHVGLFGDQTQFSNGLALTIGTPMMTVIVGRKSLFSRFSVVSTSDVGKPHKIMFSCSKKRPLRKGEPGWLNHIKGVMANFKGGPIPGFEALIETSIPFGVGFGSSSALEVAMYTFLEILVGVKTDPVIDKVLACQKANHDFLDTKCGIVERFTSAAAKDRNVNLIDCQTQEVFWIPFSHKDVTFVAVNTHLKDKMLGTEYEERSKYISKACEILQITSLRQCSVDDLTVLEERVHRLLEDDEERVVEEREAKERERIENAKRRALHPELNIPDYESDSSESLKGETWSANNYARMMKRVRFYITEMLRIREAVLAWKENDLETFGKKLVESHLALIEDFEFYNPFLNFLVETSLESDGVYGARMTGMGLGFGGGIVTMVQTKNVQQYCEYLISRFSSLEQDDSMRQSLIKNVAVQRSKRRSFLDKFPKRDSKGNIQETEFDYKNYDYEDDDDSVKEEDIKFEKPSFYILSPTSGARMMFVTKTDFVRSYFATQLPHPKELVMEALHFYNETYDTKAEAVGLAPATVCLFGEYMDYHFGYILYMALPLLTVTVGGKGNNCYFTFRTTSSSVEKPTNVKSPVPCVRDLKNQPDEWVNFTNGVVHNFKHYIPGFNALIHSTVPCSIGVNSCSALQASVYTFLEGLTLECTPDPYEKAERCLQSEKEFATNHEQLIQRCSVTKYLPTLLCKEGNIMCLDTKKQSMEQFYFDDPRFVFILASCKICTTEVTIEKLNERVRLCQEAAEILNKETLADAEYKHIRCLTKRDATPEMIQRVKYVIGEHQRTREAIRAIENLDYEHFGMLMNQSHASLRDEYGVSSLEIENIVRLALRAEGVLGAKMVGKGLHSTVIILVRTEKIDTCIRLIRRKYQPVTDKPNFYVVKPSRGAFNIDLKEELFRIP